MTTNLENLGSNKVRLEIKLPPERLEEAAEQVFRKTRGNYVIPGFRKGKAPRTVIEQRFGTDVFYRDALDPLLQAAYPEAVQETGIEVVGDPFDVKVDEFGPDVGAAFSVTCYVVPTPELPEWKGLHAKRVHYDVTEDMIDAQVARTAEENARWVPVDGPSEMGDEMIIDYAGSLNGEPIEGGTSENERVLLGSGLLLPGFENQIAGMKAGEERDIVIRFPAKSEDEALAGQDVDFHVAAREVRRKELPEIDDEFAQDVSEYDTMDEYREHLREHLREQLDERTRTNLNNDLVAEVVAGATVEIPPPLLKAELENDINETSRILYMQGVPLEAFLAASNMTMDDFVREESARVAMEVKMRLVVSALVDAMGVEVTDEERERRIEELAQAQNVTADVFRGRMTEAQKDAIDYGLKVDRMLERLVENAEIEDVNAEDLSDAPAEAPGAQAPGLEI